MNEIREHLESLADEQNRKFSNKLIPGAENVLGVRMPLLRKYAKELAAQPDFRDFLDCGEYHSYEELMLRGMIMQYAKMDLNERLGYVRTQIPLINNWALCDSMDFRYKSSELETIWEFIQPYLSSPREFDVRYGLIVIMKNFILEDWAEAAFRAIDNIQQHDYYVQMGIAWTISDFFIKLRGKTLDYLHNNQLDTFTFNKAIQKCCESARISDEDKVMLRGMKK